MAATIKRRVFHKGSSPAQVLAALGLVGVVAPFAGTTAPAGWLFCYGQAVSRTTYAALFSSLSTTYGTGDGSTTFNLPDLRGRVVAGQDDMGGTSANRLTGQSGGVNGDNLGEAGGAETHTLAESQIPSHTHTQQGTFSTGSGSSHAHSISYDFASNFSGGGSKDGVTDIKNGGAGNTSKTLNPESSHTHSVTISGSTQAKGGGGAHNNVQPTLILNYIIFAGV